MRIFLAILLTVFFVTHEARAQDDNPPIPGPVQKMVEQGAQIRYLGRSHGLDGWITMYNGTEQYFYVQPDGSAFVMGLLFDADGKSVTVKQVEELQKNDKNLVELLENNTQPDPAELSSDEKEPQTTAEKMFQSVEKANWVVVGKSDAPVIYSFVDPQCPHCHNLMKDLREDYIEKGLIQARLIPVGFREETLAQAAYMLAAPDAANRFFAHLDGVETALPVDAGVSTTGVEQNVLTMHRWKFDVTPITVYRNKSGEIKIVRGRIKDIPALLDDLR